ncbi:MAG: hypothetical protein QOE66_247, partial [Chloroflexota bacterium]|nr:hypothetical protein [Chloroflexota bacterium]
MVAPPSPLEELAGAAGAARTCRLETEFDLPGGMTLKVHVDGYQTVGPWYGWLRLWEMEGDRVRSTDYSNATSLDDAIREVVSKYPKAVLRPGSVTVRIQKGTTTGAKVRPIAVRAWHQAYGLPIPSLEEVARQRKKDRAALQAAANDIVALLKTGRSGVKEFNRRPAVERAKTDLRKADLSGSDLGGIQFFSGARLSGA